MGTAISPSIGFNPVQLQLLKMFSRISDEQTLGEVQLLSEFFARKAEEKMDELWDKPVN